MSVKSYGDHTTSSGVVEITQDTKTPLADRHVLLVEDIVDTGLTLKFLRETLQGRRPKSLATCALLSKPSRRQVQVPVEYVGFKVPDVFVVGYGMDFAQAYRALPYLGTLTEGDLS